jgi:hypothetical protein
MNKASKMPKVWDAVAYACAFVGAVTEAADAALKASPNLEARMPDLGLAAVVPFIPLTLLTIAGLIWLVRVFRSTNSTGASPPMRRLSWIEEKFPTTDWDAPFVNVFGKEFKNEVVPVGGRDFIKCKFTNVTFLYNGQRHVPKFTDCEFGPKDNDGKVRVEFRTENPIVADTVQFFNFLSESKFEDYRLIQEGTK